MSNEDKIENDKVIDIKHMSHLDILGYTINIASKITSFADPNQLIVGEEVYRNLDIQTKRKFKKLDMKNIEWNFVNNSTGNTYELFVSH